MKNDFIIQPATAEEIDFVCSKKKEFNEKNVPLMKAQVERICKVIKDSEGNIIAGTVCFIHYNFKSLYIDLLWVKEEFRKCSYGSMLLQNVEKEAFEKGINFVHLGTLGFQAKDFYIKKGYEVFAVLDECALNSKMYSMKKVLNNKSISSENNNVIEDGTADEVRYIDDKIVEYNSKQVSFTNEPAFYDIHKVIKDPEGNVIAGILSTLLPWTDLIIDDMWVSEDCIEEELKVKLLNEVEKDMKERGGHVAMHETFNVKTRDFYIKIGYEVYGILDDYPGECKAYYMKKISK